MTLGPRWRAHNAATWDCFHDAPVPMPMPMPIPMLMPVLLTTGPPQEKSYASIGVKVSHCVVNAEVVGVLGF